jgi:hypothetical protein
MTLPDPKRSRLIKVLALAASPNDYEALAAVRTAQRLLTSEGLTWGDVIPPATAPDTSDLETTVSGTVRFSRKPL